MPAETLGPIAYVIVEFPGSKMTGGGLPILVDLVDRGVIRIIDLLFVKRDTDGSIEIVNLGDIDGDGTLDLTVFEGASSGLLSESDVKEASGAIDPGSSAAILVYENTWAKPFADELRKGGAQLVAAGFIPQDDLMSALDATE